MAKILVTGANGQLGSELKDLSKLSSHQFQFTDIDELNLLNEKEVKDYFNAHKPDVCINCAAYTAVDKAEEDSEIAYKVNVEAVKNLAKSCSVHSAELFHISTDFVFDGSHSVPYTEKDDCNPISIYGETKREGELTALAYDKSYVIRTSWLYSSFGNNFVKTMIRLGREREQLGVIYDQIGTPTYAKDLAHVILTIIDSDKKAHGLYHFSNEGVASWYDFAYEIFESAGINVQLSAIPTEAYPTPAKRPHYSLMSKAKTKESFDLEIRHWKEALKECLSLLNY